MVSFLKKMSAMQLLVLISLFAPLAHAQETVSDPLVGTFKEGLRFQQGNDFSMRLRFRLQNRLTLETKSTDASRLQNAEFTVRRARLRLDGYLLDPNILYNLQFSFSRGDLDWENTQYPNILRDAMVGWRWHPHHTLWWGQGKLPGNRQRTISSGAQQFVDRSIVNATFNIDRDIGVQQYSQFGDEKPLWLKLALTNGEGRNQPQRNASLATTARVEWYPLGNFRDGGDQFEADLAREQEPRLALGYTQSFNSLTSRTGGQIGKDLPTGQFRSLESRFADLFFKFRGFSFSAEWARRLTDNPLVSASHSVYVGEGLNVQGGYLLESFWEPSFRWSRLQPSLELQATKQEERHYTLGLSKYIKNNSIKWQTDLSYQDYLANESLEKKSLWSMRFQLELGI